MPETDEEVNSRSYHEPPADATYAGMQTRLSSLGQAYSSVAQRSHDSKSDVVALAFEFTQQFFALHSKQSSHLW